MGNVINHVVIIKLIKVAKTNVMFKCRYCGSSGNGKYCGQCGQPFKAGRITLPGLLHEVFHLFTHLDKGFGYTLKQLIVAPGHMQRLYVEGERGRHQKPFSMFFICATVAALARYWIYKALLNYYDVGNTSEANFFNEYMVVLHIVLLPVYAYIAYLFFYKADYNYAEIGILLLYTVSFFFLTSTVIALLKFIWPHMDTAYIELPVLAVYNVMTFVNFFRNRPLLGVILKSLLIVTILFTLVQLAEDFIVRSIA